MHVLVILTVLLSAALAQEPLRVAIAGLSHGHIISFLNQHLSRTDWSLVGVSEAQQSVLIKYAVEYELDPAILFADTATMLDATQPEAVMLFGNIYDHLEHTRLAAERGIHVMMEKPLAISTEAALQIEEIVAASNISAFVNYETTFYDNYQYTKQVFDQGSMGPVVHMIARGGHQGIDNNAAVPPEFFDWLVDLDLGGGGVSFDYACYGANTFTWLKDNERPVSVTAALSAWKEDPAYRGVDDDAMIIVSYASGSVGIIEASWNWPYHMKEVDVYGLSGSMKAQTGGRDILIRQGGGPETRIEAPSSAFVDELTLLIDIVQHGRAIDNPSSIENNIVATEILEASLQSAKCGGCTVFL